MWFPIVAALHAASNPPFMAPPALLNQGPYSVLHANLEPANLPAFNRFILDGVDAVQKTAPLGGGYFTGVTAAPAESPVGFPLEFENHPLLSPPRTTSYCSGSSYAAFIEGLNFIFARHPIKLSATQVDTIRMQEPDGSRRNDGVKLWGWWNADGFGNDFALVQYSNLGEIIPPQEAMPGDFLNISWKDGLGHSTVFLGWCRDNVGQPAVLYWSSQASTNGFADQVASLSSIKELLFVRLTNPRGLQAISGDRSVNTKIAGDQPPQF